MSASARTALAQGTDNGWVRQRVVTKEQSPLMIGSLVVAAVASVVIGVAISGGGSSS